MSLNHIVSANPQVDSGEMALDVTFNNVKILGNLTVNNPFEVFSNIEWRNASNTSLVIGVSNFIFYKVGRQVTLFISGFTGTNMGTTGQLYSNFVNFGGIPARYRPYLSQNCNFTVAKSKDSDLPVFPTVVPIFYDSGSNYFFIQNNANGGSFPSGENVIIRNTYLTYITNED